MVLTIVKKKQCLGESELSFSHATTFCPNTLIEFRSKAEKTQIMVVIYVVVLHIFHLQLARLRCRGPKYRGTARKGGQTFFSLTARRDISFR